MKRILILALAIFASMPALAMNPLVNKASKSQLIRSSLAFNKVNSMRSTNTNMAVPLHQNQKRNGVIGASVGSAIGFGVVQGVGQFVILTISGGVSTVTANPAAGASVFYALEKTMVPMVINPLSYLAGTACGVALGTITGPV